MAKSPTVYFFCRDEEGNLQEDVIVLAEGFKKLGIKFFANCNYWKQSSEPDDYLFKHDPQVLPEDCDVVVVSYTWTSWMNLRAWETSCRELPDGLFKSGRKYITVYMDSHDGHRTVSWEGQYRQFDLILRSKMNHRFSYPANFHPWVLGFTNRMIDAIGNPNEFGSRRDVILVNFGASHPFPHGVRTLAKQKFEPVIEKFLAIDSTVDDLKVEPGDPYEALMWRQTGCRFSQAYYERLKTAKAVACFCGELIPPMPFNRADRYMVGGNKAKLWRKFYDFIGHFDPRPLRAVQWDSFRFWEALVAGCVAFNSDLDKYGVRLPVMPTNGKHYIGIDFGKADEAVSRLRDEPAMLADIARQGRDWAFANYSSEKMAVRFLGLAGFKDIGAQSGK